MTAVMVSYALGALVLIVAATAYAVHLVSQTFQPALWTSLDCRDGVHGGCPGCDGCSCHTTVLR